MAGKIQLKAVKHSAKQSFLHKILADWKKYIPYVIGGVFLAFLLISNLVVLGRLKQLDGQLNENRSQSEAEASQLEGKLELLEQNLYFMAKKSNDLRRFLDVSPVEYSFFQTQESEDSGEEGDAPQPDRMELAMYSSLEILQNNRLEEIKIKEFNLFINSDAIKRFQEINGLRMDRNHPLSVRVFSGNLELGLLSYDLTDLTYTFSSIGFEDLKSESGDEQFLKEMSGIMNSRKQILQNQISLAEDFNAIFEENEYRQIAAGKWANVDFTTWKGLNIGVVINKKDGPLMLKADLDPVSGEITLTDEDGNERSYNDISLFRRDFLDQFLITDDRPETAQRVDDAQIFLKEMLTDDAFVSQLNRMGLTPDLTPKYRDEDFIYFDLFGDDGELAGSYAVQQLQGNIFLMDKEDVPIRGLLTLQPGGQSLSDSTYETTDDIQQINDLYSAEGSINILLAGRHGPLTDSMIIVHADREKGKAVMFSVPRDLYWEGQKLNSYYSTISIDRLVREITAITGLQIDHYMLVDMYAFIEIIDILGGIDVTLTEDLVDPYYKVKTPDGTWTTLHYTAGDHHISGIEALRIARSRYTSSDYSRSRRQQIIIMGIKERVQELSLADMSMTMDIIKTAFDYLETDLTPTQILRLFNDYKHCDVDFQNTIDTSTVLYYTYTNLYLLSKEEQEEALQDPEFQKGQWILLPRNNDWNLIRWYVRQLIKDV